MGVAAATALVSGLGNLGSVTTTYALYTGWPGDNQPGPKQYHKSNLTMVGILAASAVSAIIMGIAVRVVDGKKVDTAEDGAAKRQARKDAVKGGFLGKIFKR